MTALDLVEELSERAETFVVEEATKVQAKDLGLDSRAAYRLYVTADCIIVPRNEDRTMQYYGGFEYVDKECRREAGEYVFYFSEDSRVAGHLDRYADKVEI